MPTTQPNKDKAALGMLMRRNNPNKEDVGPFTGRCAFCGSKDMQVTNSPMAWRCKCCGASYVS
jgi:ribosomal protein L37AE/L43A